MSADFATTSVDSITQTTGADTLTISAQSQIQRTDFFDGNDGTDTIVIFGTGALGAEIDISDFFLDTDATHGFHNYEALTFLSDPANPSGRFNLLMDADQFGTGLISNALAVTGATEGVPQFQQILIFGASNFFSAAEWTFNSWNPRGTDTIQIFGIGTNDTLIGSSQNDIIAGQGGNDTITGGAGNDTLFGGLGDDTAVYSGSSIDYLVTQGSFGLFTITDRRANSPDGTDNFTLQPDQVVESFQFANTTLTMAALLAHPPVIISDGGGASASVSVAENSTAVTTVSAVDPNAGQTLTFSIVPVADGGDADAAKFTIDGSTGALAFLTAPDYEHPTDAGASPDNIYNVTVQVSDGHGGADTQAIAVTVTNVATEAVTGDGGDNLFFGAADEEAFFGQGGSDTVSYASANAAVTANLASSSANKGDAAGDSYNSIENLTGSAFNDKLTGNDGDNVLEGGAGADRLNGGKGTNTASYEHAASGVTADLSNPANNTGDAAGDTYTNIQNLLGSGSNDRLVGDDSNNVLNGGDGQDTLIGNGGKDTLIGGAGSDILTGGAGNDTLVFLPGFGNDTVTDFLVGSGKNYANNHDTLDLSGLDFNSLQDVWDNTTNVGTDAVIHSGADTITVEDVTLAQLQSHPLDVLI